MRRFVLALASLWLIASASSAQELGGLARIDAVNSRVSDDGWNGARIDLVLSQGVPYRLFTLDNPPRLVMDFQEVDWAGLDDAKLSDSARILRVQYGTYVPGWSRMVAELADPMAVMASGLQLDDVTGAAHVSIRLSPVSPQSFADSAGEPHDPRWDLPKPAAVAKPPDRDPNAPMVVVLDPGHGGIDPGAETEIEDEKTLMLQFARELRELLMRSGGFQVVLTRDSDRFVSLEERVVIAHKAGADVFLSLHADALAGGQAEGATVHVLSREASDIASAKLAERHDRGELLSGVDLSGTDDQITDVLLDLARLETQPRTEALAKALVAGMENSGGPMNRRPLRKAEFSVLKAADIPSVLVEVGFLSSPRDLKNLHNSDWRAQMAHGIRNGLLAWRISDESMRGLVRH